MTRSTPAVLLLAVATSAGCSSSPTQTDLLTTTATVRYVDVEGGCWRLDAKDGTHYEPVDLAPAFRTDGLRVAVTLRFTGNYGSFCMVGRLAEVVTIRGQ